MTSPDSRYCPGCGYAIGCTCYPPHPTDPTKQETEGDAAPQKASAVLATSVSFNTLSRMVSVTLSTGAVMSIPQHLMQGLAGARLDECLICQVEGGVCVRWPTLDLDFNVDGLMRGSYGNQAWMAQGHPAPDIPDWGRIAVSTASASLALPPQEPLSPSVEPCPYCNGGIVENIVGDNGVSTNTRIAHGPSTRNDPCPHCTTPVDVEALTDIRAGLADAVSNVSDATEFVDVLHHLIALKDYVAVVVMPALRTLQQSPMCRIYEYDGAFKCLTHDLAWGAIDQPDTPCPGWEDLKPQSGGGWREQPTHDNSTKEGG